MESLQKKEGAVKPIPSLTNNRFTGESYTTKQRYKNYVPLDGFTAQIIDTDFTFLLSYLDFYDGFNTRTGEVRTLNHPDGKPKRPRVRAQYKGLSFTYYPKFRTIEKTLPELMIVHGSFHKFWNQGTHNANQFNFDAFLDTLTALKFELSIIPSQIHLTRLEWGLNLIPEIEANQIINGVILNSGNNEYKNSREYKNTTNRVCYFTEWEHKIYNKSEQYPDYSDPNTLRIEHKQKAWHKHTTKFKIGSTLHDLIESDFKGLRTTFLKDWERVLFVDPILKNLPEYYAYSNPKFWKDLNSTGRYQVRANAKKRLEQLSASLGSNLKQNILERLTSTIDEMNNVELRIPYLVYIQNPILTTHFGLTG